MQKLYLILTVGFLTGCTYSKPVITEMTKVNNELIIEKCQIQYHPFVGIRTLNCSNYKV